MTREEAISKAINIVSYFEAHFAKSKEAREDAVNIIEALEQEPCTDAIGRQAAIYAIKHAQVNFNVESEIDFTKHKREVQEIIKNVLGAQEKALKELPPVTPAEKVGQWEVDKSIQNSFGYDAYVCSVCETIWNSSKIKNMHYCPTCGAKMQEVKE